MSADSNALNEARWKTIGLRIASSGFFVMIFQNAILIAGLLLLLVAISTLPGNPMDALLEAVIARMLLRVSLSIDFLGIGVIGMGFLLFSSPLGTARKGFARSSKRGNSPETSAFVIALACFVWISLTLLWRLLVPLATGISILNPLQYPYATNSGSDVNAIHPGIQIMKLLWVLASASLILASLAYLALLNRMRWNSSFLRIFKGEEWLVFSILNFLGTALCLLFVFGVAEIAIDSIWSIFALFLKLIAVPILGIVAYYGLARRALSLTIAPPETSNNFYRPS